MRQALLEHLVKFEQYFSVNGCVFELRLRQWTPGPVRRLRRLVEMPPQVSIANRGQSVSDFRGTQSTRCRKRVEDLFQLEARLTKYPALEGRVVNHFCRSFGPKDLPKQLNTPHGDWINNVRVCPRRNLNEAQFLAVERRLYVEADHTFAGKIVHGTRQSIL